MAEYINREALLKILKTATHFELMDAIEDAPAADVAPVVRGRWEKSECDWFELHVIKCSVCHEEWCFEEEGDVVAMHYKYCPNCGAKMEGRV